MTMYRVGPAGIPASLKTNMDAVLNKKFGTSTTYAPATWPDNVNLLGPLPEKTASGSVVSITDGADGVPLKNWGVTVDATLSGVSSLVCTQTGKNLMPPTSDSNYWEEGNINASGANQSGSTFKRTIGYISVKGFTNALLCLSGYTNTGTSDRFRIFRYDKNFNFISYANLAQGKYYINEEVYYIRMRYDTTAITWANEQLEYIASVDDNPTSYEPYTAPTVNTVSLGRTIYGGQADVVNGTGTEKYVKIVFDGSDDEGWGKTNAGPYYTILTGYYKEQGFTNGICDSFTMVPEVGLASNLTTDLTCSFYFGSEQNRFYIRYDAMANVEAFKTWLSQNPVTVIYKVATQTDFTFTPITPTPETALGVNNFWTDEGDSEVTYRADINMLIASLSGNRGLMMARPQLEEITEETKEDPEVTEK